MRKGGSEQRSKRHFGRIGGQTAFAADEFREAIFCAQAAAERPICSESDVHFLDARLILCAGCGDAAQWLGAESGDEFRDAISCAQAAAERPVCSQSDVHFSLKSRGWP